MIHPYKDNSWYTPNPHSNSSTHPFGVDLPLKYTKNSKGEGEELHWVAPVQSAHPEHRLTACFDPPITGNYANNLSHFP